jgi:L-ornithine N5-oxygenase
VYFPSFVQKYYNATAEHKHRLNSHLKTTNYSASDLDVLEALYSKMYHQRITDTQTIRIFDETQILCSIHNRDSVTLSVTNPDNQTFSNDYDLVILATGFRDIGPGENQEPHPRILDAMRDHLLLDEHGSMRVRYDYSVPITGEHVEKVSPSLYLNGLCESSHGMGDAGSFSLLALRSEIIAKSLLKNTLNNTFNSTLALSVLTDPMNPSSENQYND